MAWLSSASPWKTRSLTITALIGRYDDDSAFAQVRMSGSMFERLAAPVVAGAPEAADHLVGDQQHVVFAQHRLDLLEIRPRGGMITPPAPMIGSAHIAATVSGPSARISFSSSSAQRVAKASSLSPGSAPW